MQGIRNREGAVAGPCAAVGANRCHIEGEYIGGQSSRMVLRLGGNGAVSPSGRPNGRLPAAARLVTK